jgi:hypothetical protein
MLSLRWIDLIGVVCQLVTVYRRVVQKRFRIVKDPIQNPGRASRVGLRRCVRNWQTEDTKGDYNHECHELPG